MGPGRRNLGEGEAVEGSGPEGHLLDFALRSEGAGSTGPMDRAADEGDPKAGSLREDGGRMRRPTPTLYLLGLTLGIVIAASPVDQILAGPHRETGRRRPHHPPHASPGSGTPDQPRPGSPVPPAPASGQVTVEILFSNDIHGYLRSGPAGWGGAGAMANLVDEARKRAAGDPSYDVIVLDGGDLFGGGAEDNLTRGKSTTDFVVGVRYDACTLGNHDFGFGLAELEAHVGEIRNAGVKVLGANILRTQGSLPATDLAEPSCVFVKRGVKIGIVGVTTPGTGAMNLNEDTELPAT
jgi:2',3'-cyclic-nucleotide 2'-phosphodiesterase (5'-nucleotidase family)